MADKNLQFEIDLPCQQSWERMQGTATVRFCDVCAKSVYNIAIMPREAVSHLLNTTDPCVRLFRRNDGTAVVGGECLDFVENELPPTMGRARPLGSPEKAGARPRPSAHRQRLNPQVWVAWVEGGFQETVTDLRPGGRTTVAIIAPEDLGLSKLKAWCNRLPFGLSPVAHHLRILERIMEQADQTSGLALAARGRLGRAESGEIRSLPGAIEALRGRVKDHFKQLLKLEEEATKLRQQLWELLRPSEE